MSMRKLPAFPAAVVVAAVIIAGTMLTGAGPAIPATPWTLDKAAETWVTKTFAAMSLDEKVGQLLTPTFESSYIATDSEEFERLARLVKEQKVGGMLVFGGSEAVPSVLLNPAYGSVTLGNPLNAASMYNRLQALATVPLLNPADFEGGLGFRIKGGTRFPNNMAFGAVGDEQLAYESGRITALESRAIGVHVNFAPVLDVNNNARNPVINTRSFGEDPALVGRLGAAYVRGLRAGGMMATLKHFPGHGDTDVDSHLGLPIISVPRERLDQVELPPFREAIAAGAEAVMTAHIELPALDPDPNAPATLSRRIATGLLRDELQFKGLVYTDSFTMQAITNMLTPAEAAVKAIKAGNDMLLHSPDDVAAHAAIKAAVESGEIPLEQVNASVQRILRAKASLNLHRQKLVDLNAVATVVGARAHQRVVDEVSQRSVTLLKDEASQVPLRIPATASVLYLSSIDYPSTWRMGAPSRTLIPELKKRWPNLTAIELTDRTTRSELELVRAMAAKYDAIIVGTFVRTASFSGRMDLGAELVKLLRDLSRASSARQVPMVTVCFGNPYTASFLSDMPTLLVTYDFYDSAERAVARALAGEAPITGKLPIALPGQYPLGHGLQR
ncbi:MAG: hypothetical protein JNM38_24320 [Acidobacteria bacterium]|nr:hypothetical protein [Acidobacteriota bacterium]